MENKKEKANVSIEKIFLPFGSKNGLLFKRY